MITYYALTEVFKSLPTLNDTAFDAGTLTVLVVPGIVDILAALSLTLNAPNPTNATDGQKLLFEIIQDATGSRTLTLDTKFAFGTDITAFTATTTASKRDFLGVVYNSTADKFYVIGIQKGY